jgi:hypothetical protein
MTPEPVHRLMQSDFRGSINERMNLVFQDADIIPLFVQVRRSPPGAFDVTRLLHLRPFATAHPRARAGKLPQPTAACCRQR